MNDLDPRLHAYRPDLADVDLKGEVESALFVSADILCVAVPQVPVRKSASSEAGLLTEALFGERVHVFEKTAAGWAWCQLERDRYVGWIPAAALAKPGPEPTHRVSAVRTFAFAKPDIKAPDPVTLPLGSELCVTGRAEDKNTEYALVAELGAVPAQHLRPLTWSEPDWVEAAERFLHTPYLWGGKTESGIDCSGLVQIALQAAGRAAPRDSDMQEQALGSPLPLDAGLPSLRRGDLIFWKGHVAIMRNETELIHANAHHMAVAIEPLGEAVTRSEKRGLSVTSIRRLGAE